MAKKEKPPMQALLFGDIDGVVNVLTLEDKDLQVQLDSIEARIATLEDPDTTEAKLGKLRAKLEEKMEHQAKVQAALKTAQKWAAKAEKKG